jgi:hypothetical protein
MRRVKTATNGAAASSRTDFCTYPAVDGVDYGIESGWFSAGLARYLRLTDVGFNKIAAHRIGCFVILGHASSTSFKLI